MIARGTSLVISISVLVVLDDLVSIVPLVLVSNNKIVAAGSSSSC